jgi:DNA-binding MarR family transcriptional regulator
MAKRLSANANTETASFEKGGSGQEFGGDALQRVTLGYLINLLARLLAQTLKVRNGPGGILPGQFTIVLELLNESGLTQRELCEHVKVEQATMANTLKRMERDGLLVRKICAEDGRQSRIHLTERGANLGRVAMANALEVNRVALDGLSGDEQSHLRKLLIDMTERLESDLSRYRDD